MPTDSQRTAMLAAMGIEVWRLRGAAAASTTAVAVFADARAQVCVSGASSEAAFAWLPLALRVRAANIRFVDHDAPEAIAIADGALPRDAAGKRALWQALKPLARRLHEAN